MFALNFLRPARTYQPKLAKMLGIALVILACLGASTSLFANSGAKPAEKAKHGGHGAAKKPEKKAGGHGEKKPEKKPAHGAEKKSGGHGGAAGKEGEKHEPAPPDPTYAPELAELLHLIDENGKKSDSQKFVELDLGEYKLTHSGDGAGQLASIAFHIFAIVPETKLAAVEAKMPTHEKRLRDTILSTVHEASYQDINEPSMPTVKGRLTTSINRVLGVVEVRDVVFSNLATKQLH